MCNLEKVFSPSFFDMQLHVVCHLVDEVALAGPVHARWMYWVERYMKVLKDWVKQRARPKGCMAAAYLIAEALFYSAGMISAMDKNAPTAWEEKHAKKSIGLHLHGKHGSHYLVDNILRLQIHNYVLENREEMAEWRNEYRSWVEEHAMGQGVRPPSFQLWANQQLDAILMEPRGMVVDEDVQNIIRGPREVADSYTHMYESGRHFRTWQTDHMKKIVTNCNIYMMTNDGEREMPCVGTIMDILDVDFGSFTTVVLECKWHKSIMSPLPRATMVLDECGFYRVNIARVVPTGNEFSDIVVFPNQVDQCLMVPMQTLPSWSIVVPIFPRHRRAEVPSALVDDEV
ncbi:unnamed protein product [Calypogeia fissa]